MYVITFQISNKTKRAISTVNIQKKFWGGVQPLPRLLSHGEGTPLPEPTPLGASTHLAPLARDLAPKPKNQTLLMVVRIIKNL